MPFSTTALLILLISAFFAKNQNFLAKIVPLLKANSIRAVLEIFKFCFQVLEDKELLLMKM